MLRETGYDPPEFFSIGEQSVELSHKENAAA